MKVLVLLISTLAFTKGQVNVNKEPECSSVRPGRYCNKDLSGFIVCNRNGQVASYSCSPGYRCPCGFNNLCKVSENCVRKPQFTDSEIPSDFTVSFNGRRQEVSSTVFEDQGLNGVIRQDLTPGDEKFAIRITFTDNLKNGIFVRRNERVIRKTPNGNFIEVSFK